MGIHTDNAATALALAGITPADYLRRAASLLDDAHHALDASELGLRSWLKVQIDELHSEAARLDAPPRSTRMVADLVVWAETVAAGEYLACYEDDGLDEVTDPGSRCGYDDATLDQVRRWLSARDLTIRTDDRGIRVEALVCPTCHDTRSVRTECSRCGGSGLLDRDGSYGIARVQDCGDCSGLGYIADECPICAGQESDDESSPDERELELQISEDRLEQLTGER